MSKLNELEALREALAAIPEGFNLHYDKTAGMVRQFPEMTDCGQWIAGITNYSPIARVGFNTTQPELIQRSTQAVGYGYSLHEAINDAVAKLKKLLPTS